MKWEKRQHVAVSNVSPDHQILLLNILRGKDGTTFVTKTQRQQFGRITVASTWSAV